MKKALGFAFAVALFTVSACRDDERTLRPDQQQYETVQEGAGGAVTGTIAAPGETAPSLMPPMTSTNADTTTAFTLPTATAIGDTAPPGTIAGSLSRDNPTLSPITRPASSAPRPAPVPSSQPSPVPAPSPTPEPFPQPPTATREPTPPPPAEPAPVPPSTTREETPPPSEDPPPSEEPQEDPPPPPPSASS